MTTLIVYSRSSTQRPRSVLASLAQWLIDQGHDVEIADISAFSYVNQDLPPRWFAKLMGENTLPDALGTTLRELGVPVFELANTQQRTSALPPRVAEELHEATMSDLVTYFRTDTVDITHGAHAKTYAVMVACARGVYDALGGHLATHHYDAVYVPNGRVPEQRLALEACTAAGTPVRFYEIGRALPMSFYAGATQVHDRLGTQHEIDDVLENISEKTITTLASTWLGERTSVGSSLNVYSTGWSHTTEQKKNTTPRAVFFSSSVDEFASYGASWDLHSWNDQYEAFENILDLLVPRGIHCTLRVHPNLTNKSAEYFRREVARVAALQRRHPSVEVLWHNEPVNSYDLVARSDYVVVGRSTLGLEASLMNTSVWMTTAGRYDLVADVRSALSAEDVTPENLTPWVVDPRGAQRFVAYWAAQDHPFSWAENSWSTWDSFRPPQKMRWGQLLVKNPFAHKKHLIRLELTRRRNARYHP